MTEGLQRAMGISMRVPPLALAALGAVLGVALVAALLGPDPATLPWWAIAWPLVPSIVLALTGLALVIDLGRATPRARSARRSPCR